MAFFALRPLLSLMLVVFLMAGVTVHGGLLVTIVSMAVLARDFRMLVSKLVASLVVIEPDLFPICIRVAVGADAAELPFVLIVLLVAGVTIRRSIAILDLGCVTGLALDFFGVGMGALEWEVSPFMTECLIRDRCDILRSTSVVCVAVLAFTLLLHSPVRSQFLLDVLANVFVAILAERILRRFVEPLVALGAVLFPFGMTLDHLAWHQGGLDVVCQGRCAGEHDRAEENHEQVVR